MTVNAGVKDKLVAYYTAEALVADNLPDSVDGTTLIQVGFPNATIVPAKIGNGILVPAFTVGGAPFQSVDPIFNITNLSWTVRFWIKFSPSGPRPFQEIMGNHGQWFVNLYDTGVVEFFTMGTAISIFTAALTPNVWHRIVVFRDLPNLIYGIRIDQNASQTHAQTAADLGYFDFNLGFPNNKDYDLFMDEIGFWKNYVWTNADFLLDWNGGVGITYPAAAAIG